MVKTWRHKKGDLFLLITTALLAGVGVLFVFDASAPQAASVFNNKYYFVKEQFLAFIIGFLMMTIFSKVNYLFWKKLALPLMVVAVILLILVFVPGLGIKTYGAKRWLNLRLITFQPSEIVKFALILYFSTLASSKKKLVAYVTPLIIVCSLIILQPDLGTTIIVGAIGMVLIFISGANVIKFFGLALLGLLTSFGLIFSSAYRRARLLTYIEFGTDPLGSSYHIRQILFSLGLGGLLGVGIGNSRQKYLFLPEAATDSIFAVIAEEVGFIGGLAIISVFLFVILRIFKVASKCDDVFGKMLAFGVGTWIGIQTIVNIGSMTALLPLTGVPLPFISFGGTSLVMLMGAVGIVLNVSNHEKNKRG